ncbi:MAG: glycosyltransferase [Candidatus Methanomethylicaceae archaeon]
MKSKFHSIKVCFASCVENIQNIRTTRLLRTIADYGCVVVAITPGSISNLEKDYPFVHYPLPVPSTYFWYESGLLNTLRALVYRLRNAFLLAVRLGLVKPNLIICREPDAWLVAILTKLWLRCKVVVELREVYDDRAYAFPKVLRGYISQLLRTFMRWLSRFTDEIIHVSTERQQVYCYLHKPGIVIGQYPELRLFSPPASHRKLDSDRTIITVIHAGPLRPTYASKQLLEAMTLAIEELSSVRLVVLGGIYDKAGNVKEIVEFLKSRGILEIVEPIPFLEVVKWLYRSHIGINLVLPVDRTHYWAAPQKLYEYLAAGLPVVAADVPPIRRVVSKYACGLLVDPFSPQEIAKAIIQLAQDKDLRHRMGQNSRQAAETEFNWEREQIKWYKVLISLQIKHI